MTCDNPHGIHGLAEVGKEYCIICPHRELGQIKITWFELQEHISEKIAGQTDAIQPKEMFIISKQLDIKAHKEPLNCACVNM